MMTSGQAFMLIDLTSRYVALKRLDPNVPITVNPYPGASPAETRMLLYPGTLFVVNSVAQNMDGARAGVDYITSPEVHRQWIEAAGKSELTPAQIAGDDRWPEQFSHCRR